MIVDARRANLPKFDDFLVGRFQVLADTLFQMATHGVVFASDVGGIPLGSWIDAHTAICSQALLLLQLSLGIRFFLLVRLPISRRNSA